ncbi:MAG: biotin--[Oscillospiraceae bacterium]|nr:biotin--[acetyl-CoA-carboxylase] ligase [Oscillospiraceae bacterium]
MLQDRVLTMLTEARGAYVSGAEMSRNLGVTRMAVSNAVRALREQGYRIASATNRGYCLEDQPDTLRPGDVLGLLPEARRETVRVFSTIDSTNTYLKREAMAGAPSGLIAIANEQTAGRGRVGRAFLSAPDCGVYLSLLLRPKCAPADCATLTSHAAVAVCRAIEAVCGVSPGIKWTNDILLGGRKVCGILTELTLEGESRAVDSVVIGIGVNVNNRPESFPPELRTVAGSIFSATGRTCERARLAAALVTQLDEMTRVWSSDPHAYLDAYRALCLTTGKEVRVLRGDTQRVAFAESILDDFSLFVRYPDGTTESLSGGEVSVRGLLGYDAAEP